MSFFDTTRPEKGRGFRKTEFLDLTPGQTTIRIIDTKEEAVKYYTHYIKGVSIKCLGEDCPVCQSNTKIFSEHPDSYRDVTGWSPRQERFAVNVFDKTPVKVCPECGAEIKKHGNAFLPVCPKCNQPVIEVKETPLNKVKVLSKGVTLAGLLNGIDASILDKDGNPIGINGFDIVLYVTGSGKQQSISPIPLADKTEPVEWEEDAKFDLTKITIELKPEEIGDLQRGVGLRDIFAARKANEVSEDFLEDSSKELSEELEKEVSELLD